MKKLLSVLLFSGVMAFGQFSVGIRIGPPPAPRVVRVQPRAPGAGYVWVDGYWYPSGRRYAWHSGYWTRAPYEGAAWVQPRYENGSFFAGYWSGGRDPVGHDHRWDRDKKVRDYNRYDRR